mgnify:CR=1 FL=1
MPLSLRGGKKYQTRFIRIESMKMPCECHNDRQCINAKEKVCEHFFLPAQVIKLDKYRQEHDSNGESYRWRDVFRVERVYCAKCGKNCYADLSDLK